MPTVESGDEGLQEEEVMSQEEFDKYVLEVAGSMEGLKKFCDESLMELEGEVVEITKALTYGQGAWADRIELAKSKRKIESIIPVVNLLMAVYGGGGDPNSYSQVSIDDSLSDSLSDAVKRYCDSLVF